MVLTQPHSILDSDASPLALLRVRRAESDKELRKSLINASFMALTLVVAFMLGQIVFHPSTAKTTAEDPIYKPPPRIFKRYVPIPEGAYVPPIPVAKANGEILPVKDQAPQDVPVIDPSAPAGPIVDDGSKSNGIVHLGPGAGGVEVAPDPGPYDPSFAEVFPEAVTRVTPIYPPIAKDAGMEGDVLVRMLVGIDGRVKRAEIEGKSAPMFDEYALAAARQWIFTPATSNGNPVPVWVRVPMKFQLH